MKLTVMGCSGAFGAGQHTTSLLVDDDILIDAGTGVGELDVDAMTRISQVFVTHCHLDHVCSIPFIVDAVGPARGAPLIVYGLVETLDALQTCLFNNRIWPDFTALPHANAPWLQFRPIETGQSLRCGTRLLTALPAFHTSGAAGYCVDSGASSLAFTGDTGPCDALREALEAVGNLRYLLIETAFCEHERARAIASRHLCPSLIAAELSKLRARPDIFITHMKPHAAATIMSEIEQLIPDRHVTLLQRGQAFEF
ncbi:MBL fold metallo-hydrolase [Paraburkholderia sp. BR14374]|uniref:MBL fold metallo-hydrolase n=1 Tax=Paraburkholderia sp. BR14374 TaxID=3237007 RepID=UPI0034CD8727